MTRADYGRISIFVLVDALGWRLAQKHNFLSDILPVRHELRTVLGFSSAAIPTLLSGKMPEAHGHWCLFRRRRFLSCFSWAWPVLALPPVLRENYRTRNAVGRVTRSLFNITGYFCLYEVPVSVLLRLDYAERKDLWTPGALSGCRNIFDELKLNAVAYCASGWRNTDEQKLASCLGAVSKSPVQCCFLYLSELDAALHASGPDSEGARQALVAAGVRIRRLLGRAEELYSDVRLFVFSDHGMTAVSGTHDLQAALRSARATGSLKRSSFLAFYDSTMARFWTKNAGSREALEAFLSSLPYGTVLSDEDKTELGLRFRRNDYGDVVFVMRPGSIILPSFASSAAPRGMHGYHPSDPDSSACLLAAKEPRTPPSHVKDMYAVFLDELGI
ncbi:MAG: alkaline phosphatase family protein [Candidatus Eisenbacteria bacterium]|nr:alkaline phosphatase family protein [Candidatus Eisenbacteria bacterium]